MATIKMTQISALTLAIATLSTVEDFDSEALAKLEDMKTALENKRSTPTKAEKEKSAENDKTMNTIVDILTEVGKPMTISEMQSASPELAELTNQKISALMRKLVDKGIVARTVEKKKTYFSLA